MKIAFIGAHGVGKSVLTYELFSYLKKKGLDVNFVGEVSRDAFKRGLPINENTHINAQGWILLTQMAREIEADVDSKIVVCDRSVIDNYIYMKSRFGKIDFYEKLILDWLKENPYDYLFKLPIVGGIMPDGIRAVDPAFQRIIDDALTKFLQEHFIEFYELPSGGRDKWLEFVARVVLRQRSLSEWK